MKAKRILQRVVVAFVTLVTTASVLSAATLRTTNFLVTANSPQICRDVAQRAETNRKQLAIAWFGTQLPAWKRPVPLTADVRESLPLSGVTEYHFISDGVIIDAIKVNGSPSTVMTVVTHEVMHAVLATHFGRPLSHWLHEGLAQYVEEPTERSRLLAALRADTAAGKWISLSELLKMTDYPREKFLLYTQSHGLVTLLVDHHGGRGRFVQFVNEGIAQGWDAAIRRHYRFRGVHDLEQALLTWIRQGCPAADQPAGAPVPGSPAVDPEPGWQPAQQTVPLVPEPRPPRPRPDPAGVAPVGGWVPAQPITIIVVPPTTPAPCPNCGRIHPTPIPIIPGAPGPMMPWPPVPVPRETPSTQPVIPW